MVTAEEEEGKQQAATPKRRCKVVVVGNSLLWGTKHPLCCPDPLAREICCLPGGHIRDIVVRITKLDQPSDYYSMFLIYVGMNQPGAIQTGS